LVQALGSTSRQAAALGAFPAEALPEGTALAVASAFWLRWHAGAIARIKVRVRSALRCGDFIIGSLSIRAVKDPGKRR
jgi:hypothetical protein